MAFSDRLNLLIKKLGTSKNQFATRLGYKNNGVLYDYTKEGDEATKPGFEFFEKLIHAKTGVNIEWLITGEGDMMLEKGTAATNNDEAAIRQKLKDMREEIKFLRERNTELTQSVLNLSGSKVIEQSEQNGPL